MVKYSSKIQKYTLRSMKNTSNVMAILVCFLNGTDYGSVDEFTAFKNKSNASFGLVRGMYKTPDGTIICETNKNHEDTAIRFEDEQCELE